MHQTTQMSTSRIVRLFFTTACMCFLASCSDNNSNISTEANDTNPDDTTNTSTDVDPDGVVPAANPAVLDPHPQPTVELTEQNALVVASAIYRAERTLASLLLLSLKVDAFMPGGTSTSEAAISLGNDVCDSGDGLAQAMSPFFAGALEPVMVSFNDCSIGGQLLNGDMALAQYDDGEQSWLIVEPDALDVQVYNETVRVESGRFRVAHSAGDSMPLESVGTTLNIVIAGYRFTLAPFEVSMEAATSASGPVTSEHKLSVASELFGGIVFSKPSSPLVIADNGRSVSGGNTIRGQGSAVIEWFAGVAADSSGDSARETVTDLRTGSEQIILDATWEEFLSAF